MKRTPTPADRLSSLATGQKRRVINIEAGHDLQARLAGLGIIPGVELHMTRNDDVGPVVVAVNKTRVVLGRGMAEKVTVG